MLNEPVDYINEGIGGEGPPQITQGNCMLLEIARNFADITDERHQEAVSRLARALAGT